MAKNKRYDTEYRQWLSELKTKIKGAQLKAVLSANKEVILLYWEIGKDLFDKQENNG